MGSSFSKAMLYFTVAALMLAMLSCGAFNKSKQDNDEAQVSDPNEEIALGPLQTTADSWWISKANQTLRLGRPLREVEGSADLLSKDIRSAAYKLMDDETFYDLVTDFSMYWYGTKVGSLFTPIQDFTAEGVKPAKDENGQNLVGIAAESSTTLQAFYAARSLASGRDYFDSLFSATGEVPILGPGYSYLFVRRSDGVFEGVDLPVRELRLEIAKRLRDYAAKVHAPGPVLPKEELCSQFTADVGDSFSLGTFDPSPSDYRIGDLISGNKVISDFRSWCFDPRQTEVATGLMLIDTAAKETTRLANLMTSIVDSSPMSRIEAANHVRELKEFKLADFGFEGSAQTSLWNYNIFYKLQNSSTNRNRKRASWVLKRFFCDDLTPINVEAPTESHTDQHGSNPACYSCHYKLDPMAGYFRELGGFGQSYAGQSTIRFDDNATQNREVYEKPWKASPESGRTWNIGFIRSTVDHGANTYGENFSDLLQLLKTAPEVKQCFVKRVFEYVVGEEQTFDRAWATGVVQRMNEAAKTSSKDAIKSVFADMVTSRAFLARERNNNVCYDLPEGVSPKNRAPCRVAAILERQCTSCHSASSSQGGLDLSTWKTQGGVSGFVHTRGGFAVAASETFKAISERLNDTDPNRRMPLMKTMPATEREELFLWLQKQ